MTKEENDQTSNSNDLDDFLYEKAHKIDLDTLFSRLGIKNIKQGLSDKHASQLLERDGPNLVTQIKPKQQDINFFSGLALYLWMISIAFFSLYTYNVFKYNEAHIEYLIFGIISLIAIGFYAVFSHVQETNLKHVQSNFCVRNNLDKNKLVKVVRDGHYKIINSEHLVIGDIVHLEHSEEYIVEIPADIRIIKTNDLVKVDNSLLTGDSDPEHVSTDLLHDDPTKTRNVAFFKTKMVGGNCQGVVIRTGERTLIARMSRTSQTKEKLLEMLSKFVHMWTSACFPGGVENPYD